MKSLPTYLLLAALFLTSCSRDAPTAWMIEEREAIREICPLQGMTVPEKTGASSQYVTWSCSYPKEYDKWLVEFGNKFTARGWYQVQESNVDWQTYCHKEKYVHLRLGKVKEQDSLEPKLLISIRYPASACTKPSEPEKSK